MACNGVATSSCLSSDLKRGKCPDKDSDKRQRAGIAAFAKHAKFTIVDEYYDAAVSGADPVDQPPGFCRDAAPVGSERGKDDFESPDRFARDTPTPVLVRRCAGPVVNSRRRAPWRNCRGSQAQASVSGTV